MFQTRKTKGFFNVLIEKHLFRDERNLESFSGLVVINYCKQIQLTLNLLHNSM